MCCVRVSVCVCEVPGEKVERFVVVASSKVSKVDGANDTFETIQLFGCVKIKPFNCN